MLQVISNGGMNGAESFDVFTRNNRFAGVITKKASGICRVYFNSTATRGSARKFKTVFDAVAFIYGRRIKKGWGV